MVRFLHADIRCFPHCYAYPIYPFTAFPMTGSRLYHAQLFTAQRCISSKNVMNIHPRFRAILLIDKPTNEKLKKKDTGKLGRGAVLTQA